MAVLTWNTRYLSLIPALLLAKWHGTRTVLWGHGYSKSERRWGKWFRDRVGRLATALLFYDEKTRQSYSQAGWDDSRLFVAPNALDQAPIQAACQAWQSFPDRLEDFQRANHLCGRDIILYCSRLDPHNRVDRLIDALAELRHQHPTILAVIIGSGDDEIQSLKTRASQINVTEHCRFLGAIYDEHDLAPWFLSARLFCYPENIGLSLLHAFGYGLPVVTSDSRQRQNPEIVALRDGINGLTYQHGDTQKMASAISDLVRDAGLRARLATAAKETAIDQFSLDRMVDGMTCSILGRAMCPVDVPVMS